MEYRVSTPAAASPEDVWRLFVDVERWPDMTRSLRAVRRVDGGPFQVGSEAIVRATGQPRARWRVTEMEPGRSFVWQTRVGAVTTVGAHIVDPDAQGSVITSTLGLHGPAAGLVGALMGRLIQRNITMEVEGFKHAAEADRA
jgi:uncharacterized membrane protein